MDSVILFLTYLFAVSIAAERFTEISKSLFLDKLTTKTVVYQIFSGLFGAVLCYLQPPEVKVFELNIYFQCLLVGLIVSGGSATINDIMGTLRAFKNNLKAN